MLLDSLWPLALIAAGCACVVSWALGYDRGHSRGYEQAREVYLSWLSRHI